MRTVLLSLVALKLTLVVCFSARAEDTANPVAIKVLPEKQTLQKEQAATVVVKATFADGSEKDVTAVARYQSQDAKIATVIGGKITPQRYGETAVAVTYLHRSAVVKVAVPQPLPGGFPNPGTNNKIDELVNAKLRALGIPASELSTEQEFLRRVFLDVIGTLPNPTEYKEEIVCLDVDKVLTDPVTKAVVRPRPLGGEAITLAAGEDARVKLAAWLTAPENPWFANCAVNRVWYWLMGRGIVHEPDDLRPMNPPSNPQLLAHLAGELVAHKYDLKHIFRLVLNSRTYQRSSQTTEGNAHDATHFSHCFVRRLPAESLADAIAQVTGTPDHYSSYVPQPHKKLPQGFRAIQLDDGSISSGFLAICGRPQRDSPYEHARVCRTSMAQELYLFNAQQLMDKIGKGQRIGQWLADKMSDALVVENLFLSALSRLPTEREKQAALAYLGKDLAGRRAALEDLMWVVLNMREFLFNH